MSPYRPCFEDVINIFQYYNCFTRKCRAYLIYRQRESTRAVAFVARTSRNNLCVCRDRGKRGRETGGEREREKRTPDLNSVNKWYFIRAGRTKPGLCCENSLLAGWLSVCRSRNGKKRKKKERVFNTETDFRVLHPVRNERPATHALD